MPALDLMWHRYTGIKHVWQADTGFPFEAQPDLNEELVAGVPRVLYVQRRNLLQRCVSEEISRKLQFWIGSKDDFAKRAANVSFEPLSLHAVEQRLALDAAASERRLRYIASKNLEVMNLYYEDLYPTFDDSQKSRHMINSVLDFLRFRRVTREEFEGDGWLSLLDRKNKWSSPEIYSRIPGVQEIERKLGGSQHGCLFDEAHPIT